MWKSIWSHHEPQSPINNFQQRCAGSKNLRRKTSPLNKENINNIWVFITYSIVHIWCITYNITSSHFLSSFPLRTSKTSRFCSTSGAQNQGTSGKSLSAGAHSGRSARAKSWGSCGRTFWLAGTKIVVLDVELFCSGFFFSFSGYVSIIFDLFFFHLLFLIGFGCATSFATSFDVLQPVLKIDHWNFDTTCFDTKTDWYKKMLNIDTKPKFLERKNGDFRTSLRASTNKRGWRAINRCKGGKNLG